jgi:hypothetical protein
VVVAPLPGMWRVVTLVILPLGLLAVMLLRRAAVIVSAVCLRVDGLGLPIAKHIVKYRNHQTKHDLT